MLVLVRSSVFTVERGANFDQHVSKDHASFQTNSLNNSSLTGPQPPQINDVSLPLREIGITFPNRDSDPPSSKSRSSRDCEEGGRESEEESGSEHEDRREGEGSDGRTREKTDPRL
jgi:hypothetical protein